MALIKINDDVFINPDKIESIEFSENVIRVVMPGRSYTITEVNAFAEIQKSMGQDSEALQTLKKSSQFFGG